MTLTAPRRARGKPLVLELEGAAQLGDTALARRAVPADDRMQAFILRHLVPAQDWLVVTPRAGRRNAPPVTIATPLPVTVPTVRNARVDLRIVGVSAKSVLHLRLDNPPAGIALDGWEAAANRLTVFLKADAARITSRIEDNLIVEVWADLKGRRTFVGHLPAIAIAASGP
jgi:hypothetical protein